MSEKWIGISNDALAKRYGVRESLEICARAGFDAVDFSLNPFARGLVDVYAKSDDEITEYFQGIRKRADELGLRISQTHGIFNASRSGDDAYNEWVLETTRRDLLASSLLGAPACVIHSISDNWWLGSTPEVMQAKCKEMYDSFIPYAEAYGVDIALETFGTCTPGGVRRLEFFGDVRQLKKQYDSLDTKNKALCMDTGHTNNAYAFDKTLHNVADAIRYLGPDIKVLHLNDNNGLSDQHLAPMVAGDSFQLKWGEIFAALEEIGYSGVYNFELSMNGYGTMLEDATLFLGKFLRRFVDGTL